MTPRQFSPRGAFRAFFTALLVSSASGCVPTDLVDFEDAGTNPGSGGASVPGSGGAAPSSGGAPGSGGAPVSSGGAPGSGGRGSGGAVGSGGAPGSGGRGTGGAMTGSGGAGTGTGGRGTGGAGTGTGGRGGSGTATGGTTGGGGATAATFASVATILGTKCATGTCHQAADHVDLRNNAGLHGRIVGQMPAGTGAMAQCKTMTLVVAGNPASSVISQIVKARVTACGARMPDNCTGTGANACLTTAQIATIDAWIMAGAPM